MNKEYWKLIGYAALAFGLYRLYRGYQGAAANAAGTPHSWQYPLWLTLAASKDLYIGVGAVATFALYKGHK